ncbi:MAG: hypothetical protein PHS93_03130 [Candidatus Omnitrophica bacterium]|nr:hypothetical protein [Candidatus Omnitrophota bacterium]MDD5352144.1 hypothetical protein [Candidatus Omnitrophota bacterium]MDD5549742.1 hypothetical protein [Candidatus Omnitrophota bacterium]
MIRSNKAQALIAAIVIMLILALFGVIGLSLLGTQIGHSATGLAESTQAFYLANAGLEWYMQQLANDNNWSNQVNPPVQSLGPGTFEVTLSNKTVNKINVVSTGRVMGPDGRYRESFIQATVRRSLTKYAVFWNELGPGAQLKFINSGGATHVIGDMWSRGTTIIDAHSDVTNGIIYYAQGEKVAGSGSYTAREVKPPFPQIPLLDTSYYDKLMDDWNSRIDAADINISPGSGDIDLTSNVDWSGKDIAARDINTNGFNITGTDFKVTCRDFNIGKASEIDSHAAGFTINCSRNFNMTEDSQINANKYRINCSNNFNMVDSSVIKSRDFSIYIDDNFDTDGKVLVDGNGYIVCSNAGQIRLHSDASDSGIFTAIASEGNIYFLSGNDMTVNSDKDDTAVVLKGACFLYSRNRSGTTNSITIRNKNTKIDGATIIAERRIIVNSGANITNGILYVDYASSDTNNYLQITDNPTQVTGSLISRGRNDSSLRINKEASITGLVYQHNDRSTRGRAEVDGDSTITGALMVRQFDGDSFGPATVTYNIDSIPLPNGFQAEEVTIESGSWDGL